MQHGFRVIVPRQCVGDRAPTVHEANLFDIGAKIGDVVPKDVVMQHLSGLPDGADGEAPAKRQRVTEAV